MKLSTLSKRKRRLTPFFSGLFAALCIGNAYAVPTLQVGAPGGAGEGTYANYASSLSNPTEDDTAVTSGNTLYLGGAYKATNSELQIGGKYTDPADMGITPQIAPGTMGNDWSNFGFDATFNGSGAILMAVVPDGTLGGVTLTVNGMSAIFSTEAYKSGFDVPTPPSNHAPIQDQAYMFFDVGNFLPVLDGTDPLRLSGVGIPDFPPETTSNQPGEIKTVTLANQSDYDWIHFDLFALVTDTQGGGMNVSLVTTLDGNAGSHDTTWKPNGPPNGNMPEPTTLALMGLGLAGFGYQRRRKISS